MPDGRAPALRATRWLTWISLDAVKDASCHLQPVLGARAVPRRKRPDDCTGDQLESAWHRNSRHRL
eukprot:2062063-Pyramimonas_sp.AAC.1